MLLNELKSSTKDEAMKISRNPTTTFKHVGAKYT